MRRHCSLLAIVSLVASGLLIGAAPAPAGAANADKVDAKRLVLRVDDLSGTWTSSKPQSDDALEDAKVAKCLGIKGDPNKGRTGHAEGRDLENAAQLSVSSTASVFKNAKALQATLKRFDNPKLSTCMQTYLTKQLKAKKITVTNFSIEELPVTISSSRGHGRAFRLTVAVDTTDGPATIYSDEILVWNGRYGSGATVTNAATAPSTDAENEVLTALLTRLAVVS